MTSFINYFSFALVSFSVIALFLLLWQDRAESCVAKRLSRLLLVNLILIQCLQGFYLTDASLIREDLSPVYLFCLACVGPLFYLYSQHVIEPEKIWQKKQIRHFVPAVLVALWVTGLPNVFDWLYSVVFFWGGLYMATLTWSLYQCRSRRHLFNMEFSFASLFLIWAIIISIVGLFGPQAVPFFIPAQVILLSMAVMAAMHIQLNYPHLLSSIDEIAQPQYQNSTLLQVDCEAIKQQLDDLMVGQKIYQDSSLNLSSLAEHLAIKPHQLSEFVNTQLNMSFATYLRHQRVKAAEPLLQEQPDASVLSVSLTVGFKSQSAFYHAFKEIHGIAPGQYRRQFIR